MDEWLNGWMERLDCLMVRDRMLQGIMDELLESPIFLESLELVIWDPGIKGYYKWKICSSSFALKCLGNFSPSDYLSSK